MTTATKENRPRTLEEVRASILKQYGFLIEADLLDLARLDPGHMVIVRCSNGRFVSAAVCAPSFIKAVNSCAEQWVRDVCLLADDPWHLEGRES